MLLLKSDRFGAGIVIRIGVVLILVMSSWQAAGADTPDAAFAALAERFVDDQPLWSPVAATGYGFQHVSVNGFSGTANYWYLNLGAQGRAMFNDRFGAFIRPLNFDITAGQGGAGGSWSLILGGSMDF